MTTPTSPTTPNLIGFILQNKPTQVGNKAAATLPIKAGTVAENVATTSATAGAAYAYMMHPVNNPVGTTVETAFLTFKVNVAFTGTRTITLSRATQSWTPAAIKWGTPSVSGRPTVSTGDAISVVVPASIKGATFT